MATAKSLNAQWRLEQQLVRGVPAVVIVVCGMRRRSNEKIWGFCQTCTLEALPEGIYIDYFKNKQRSNYVWMPAFRVIVCVCAISYLKENLNTKELCAYLIMNLLFCKQFLWKLEDFFFFFYGTSLICTYSWNVMINIKGIRVFY